jgi:hypothetical protein
MRQSFFSAVLVATAVAGLGMPRALHAGSATTIKGSLEMGELTRLAAGRKAEEFVLAAARLPPETPPAPGRAAVVWARLPEDKGLLLSADAAPITLTLTTGQYFTDWLLRVAFDHDGNLLLASRFPIPGTAQDGLRATSFDEHGHKVREWGLGFVPEDPEGLTADFLPDGRAVIAVPAYRGTVSVTLIGTRSPRSSRPVTLDTGGVDAAGAGRVRSLRVAADANGILVGWDRFTRCRASSRHESVVALLDESLDLVDGAPWRFASGGCGATSKRLQFLGNSAAGSLALFADGSARRVVNGEPHDFQLSAAEDEAVAAAAMDVNGRLLVVTRTTAAQEPVRLYVQAFDADGTALTDKVDVDGTVGGPRFTPEVAAALADDGAAWIAFKRDADNRRGLFLLQLTVR